MKTIRELLVAVDIELEDYTLAVSEARNPALSSEERLKLLRDSEACWRRLEIAHSRLHAGADVHALPVG